METVTIFTSHLEHNQWLFGAFHDLKAISITKALADVLLDIFQFDKESKRIVWNGLDDKDKKEAIKQTWPGNQRKVDSLLDDLSQLDEDDDNLAEIWDGQKELLLEKTKAKGAWSVYPARPPHKDVYGLICLQNGRRLIDWTKDLIKIGITLHPNVGIVNLILHDNDIDDRGDDSNHVYDYDELCEAFGGKETFDNYRRNMGIEEVNVMLFKHHSFTNVKKYLLDNERIDNVHTEVAKIVEEARKNRNKAREEGLKANEVNDEFELKLQRAFEGK